MANVNVVILVGNLTRDPEVRYTPAGTAVARLGLAINRRYKDQSNQVREETTFVDVDVWGRQAETAGQYLAKGRSVLVEGELRLDQWEDRNTGQRRSRLKVVGRRIQFLGAPGGGAGGGAAAAGAPASPAAHAPAQPAYSAPPPEAVQEPGPDLDIPEDDIPF